MFRAEVVQDPDSVVEWINSLPGHLDVRIVSGTQFGGKAQSVYYATTATSTGSLITLDLKARPTSPHFQNELDLSNKQVVFDLQEAALWPDGVVILGDASDQARWSKHAVARGHHQGSSFGGYKDFKRDGYWYPDVELTVKDKGFNLLIPHFQPTLSTWLLPGVHQYRAHPAHRNLQMFGEAVAEVREGTKNVVLEGRLVGLGEWLARCGQWDLVDSAIRDLIGQSPGVTRLAAQMRFFLDPAWANEAFESVSDDPDWGLGRLESWRAETAMATKLGWF